MGKRSESATNPYHALHRGHKVMQSDIELKAPETMHAVRAIAEKGDLLGQMTLPSPETGQSDVQLWMPSRFAERRESTEVKLSKVRAELASIIGGFEYNPTQIPNESGPMEPGIEYTLAKE